MFRRFRREDPTKRPAYRLYAAISARAREPVFYGPFQVPDTLDGRFDLLTLHAFLVLERMKPAGETGTELANAVFTGFDDALREMGVSDFGIARRIKAMANAFYGRLEAYSAVMDSEDALSETILRNVYRGDMGQAVHARALAHYIRWSRSTNPLRIRRDWSCPA